MRKHSKRVRNLPPCDPTMDLMIEAKDKEQAVFDLYRKYGICEKELFKDIVPYVRTDENAPEKPAMRKKAQVGASVRVVDEGDLAMGGEEGRVYWPEGKEEWLSPPKRCSRGGKEEVKVVVGGKNKSRQRKRQPMLEVGKADPPLKELPGKRQRTVGKTRNDGEGEPISPTTTFIVVTPATRKANIKTTTPLPESQLTTSGLRRRTL